jgi:hypothetical protein
MDEDWRHNLAVVFEGTKGQLALEALNILIDEEVETKKEVIESTPKSFDDAGVKFLVGSGYVAGLKMLRTKIENIIKESPSPDDQAIARLKETKLSEDL